MTTKQFLAAFAELEDVYIQEAVSAPHQNVWAKRGVKAAAVLLIFAGVMGTAITVSADFRQMVLSFFHIEQVESVPDDTRSDTIITQSDIGGLVKAEYIPLKNLQYKAGSGTLYQTDYEENGAIRSIRFWAVENGTILEMDSKKNSFSATWRNKTYQGDIYWCVYEGEISLYESELSDPNDANWYASSIPGRSDAVLLYLCQGRYHEYKQYPILYHLDTGDTEDLLLGTGVNELPRPTAYQWSNNLQKVIVTCGSMENGNQYYYCDVTAKTLANLENLTGVKEISTAFFADDNTLLLLRTREQKCSVFTYDLNSGKSSQTLHETKLFDHDGTMFFGGRYALYVTHTGKLSVLDLKTGEKLPVDGFTFEEGGCFLSNSSTTKLLYYVADKQADDSLGISRLGVLNLQTGSFTAFDREGCDSLQEWSVGWFDDDRAVIRSGETGTDAIYLYEF